MSGLFASRAEIGVAMVRYCAVACVLQVPTRLAGLAALQMVPSRGPVSLGIRSMISGHTTATLTVVAIDVAFGVTLWFSAGPVGAFLMGRLREMGTGIAIGSAYFVALLSTIFGLRILAESLVDDWARRTDGLALGINMTKLSNGVTLDTRYYGVAHFVVGAIALVTLISWSRWSPVEIEE